MSNLPNQTANDSYSSFDDLFDDDLSKQILENAQKQGGKTTDKASDEVPELLREQARKLTTKPFKGNPPHHGVSAEEVLNTSIIRKFSDLSYDTVPLEVITSTEKDELKGLMAEVESFDAEQFELEKKEKEKAERKLRAQKVEQTAKAVSESSPSKELAQKPVEITKSEDEIPKIEAIKAASKKQEKEPVADVALSLSPTLILMSNELSDSQKYLYSMVFDFIARNHRLPKGKDANEAQTAIMLNLLHKELPQACAALLKYFIGVLPAEDVEIIHQQYLEHPRQVSSSSNDKEEAAVPIECSKERDSVQTTVTSVSTVVGVNSNENENAVIVELNPDDELLVDIKSDVAEEKNDQQDNSETIVATSDATNNSNLDIDASTNVVNAGTKTHNSILSHQPYKYPNHTSNGGGIGVGAAISGASSGEDDDWDDIFAEGLELGLLSNNDSGSDVVLKPRTYKTTTTVIQSSSVDGVVASYSNCNNFIQYKWIFDEVRTGLNTGDLGLAPTTGKGIPRSLDVGDVFLINNVFYLIADTNVETEYYQTKHTRGGKYQGRILVITDTGKESRPFDASFVTKFDKHKDSYRIVSCTNDGFMLCNRFKDHCIKLLQDKPVKGYIYVLRSISKDPVLVNYMETSELLKIGFSTQTVEERIANAERETTYLEAPVEVLLTVQCSNYNPHTFEQVIHQVLDKRRLNVTLKSASGKSYRPKEWFTVSLEVAKEVIYRILDGSISDYHLNPINGRLTPNTPKN